MKYEIFIFAALQLASLTNTLPQSKPIGSELQERLEPRDLTYDLSFGWLGTNEDDGVPNPGIKIASQIHENTKTETVQSLLRALEEESKHADNEQQKNILNLIQTFNNVLIKAPERYAQILLNNVWHTIDMGAFGSTQRLREVMSAEDFIDKLKKLLWQILELFYDYFSQEKKTGLPIVIDFEQNEGESEGATDDGGSAASGEVTKDPSRSAATTSGPASGESFSGEASGSGESVSKKPPGEAASGEVTSGPGGEVTNAPASGEVTSAPASGGVTSAPASGEVTSAPASGGVTSAPAGGEVTSAPAGGGVTSAPAGGGVTSAPASGEVSSGPASGESIREIPSESPASGEMNEESESEATAGSGEAASNSEKKYSTQSDQSFNVPAEATEGVPASGEDGSSRSPGEIPASDESGATEEYEYGRAGGGSKGSKTNRPCPPQVKLSS